MTVRVCEECGIRRIRVNGSAHKFCKPCGRKRKKESNRRYTDKKSKDPEFVYQSRVKQAEYTENLKREVLAHYSPNGKLGCSCPHCPIRALQLLTIDHVAVSGKFHRTKSGDRLTGIKLYRWLKKQGYPTGFVTLCFCCNQAKSDHPVCPLAGQKH